jgi:hypothetical protein
MSDVTVAFMELMIFHNILKICKLSSRVYVEYTKRVVLQRVWLIRQGLCGVEG